ncbi:MAG: glycosyltransferase family 4 protein, partial [candidate division Zixibacteria bacterium]|nr:glycosyltransferase family 4 protein [candidate division Zixibacteria bacterium]
HNQESTYFHELADTVKPGFRKLYYLVEALKFKRLESILAGQLNNLMFISSDELKVFTAAYAGRNCVFLPPAIDVREMSRVSLDSRTVLLVSSLFMPNNQEAVRWYVKQVHPQFCDIEDYQLIVAGNSRGQNLDWLTSLTGRYQNITVIDSPKELMPLYQQSRLFINAMHHGAGVKLKAVEAIKNGLPVVSTTVGNQGTGLVAGRDILIADDSRQFARQVRTLLLDRERCETLVTAAQEFVAHYYNQEEILREFLGPLLADKIR